jgi:hypothetical protein
MAFIVSFRNIGSLVQKSNYVKHIERKAGFKPMLKIYQFTS